MSRFEVALFESLADAQAGRHALAEWSFKPKRSQIRFTEAAQSGLPGFRAGVRLFDAQGRYATDVEHDGAWLVRVDAARLEVRVHDASLTALGVFDQDGFAAHAPNMALDEILADAVECDSCEDPHLVGAPYVGRFQVPAEARFVLVRVRW